MSKCNMCGREFNVYDKYANFHFVKHVGYGSVLDGEYIDLHLCCECFDKTMGMIISQCQINPIVNLAAVSQGKFDESELKLTTLESSGLNNEERFETITN